MRAEKGQKKGEKNRMTARYDNDPTLDSRLFRTRDEIFVSRNEGGEWGNRKVYWRKRRIEEGKKIVTARIARPSEYSEYSFRIFFTVGKGGDVLFRSVPTEQCPCGELRLPRSEIGLKLNVFSSFRIEWNRDWCFLLSSRNF